MLRGGGINDNLSIAGIIGPGADNYTTATSVLSTMGWHNYAGSVTFTTASPPASIARSDVSHSNNGYNLWFILEST